MLSSLVFWSAALGIQLLQYVLLMAFEVQDPTDTLEAFLWRDAVSFRSHFKADLNQKEREENLSSLPNVTK